MKFKWKINPKLLSVGYRIETRTVRTFVNDETHTTKTELGHFWPPQNYPGAQMKYDSFDWNYSNTSFATRQFFIEVSFLCFRHTPIKLMCAWWKYYVIIGLIEIRYLKRSGMCHWWPGFHWATSESNGTRDARSRRHNNHSLECLAGKMAHNSAVSMTTRAATVVALVELQVNWNLYGSIRVQIMINWNTFHGGKNETHTEEEKRKMWISSCTDIFAYVLAYVPLFIKCSSQIKWSRKERSVLSKQFMESRK